MKWTQMTVFLEDNKADVALLQETNIQDDLTEPTPHHTFFVNPSSTHYSGTAIAVRKSSKISVIRHSIIYPSYLQKISLKIAETPWHIFNIYIPHDEDTAIEIVEKLRRSLLSVTAENIIIAGDFNSTLDPLRDRFRSRERYTALCNRLKLVIDQFRLTDIWRFVNREAGGFTYFTRGVPQTASRLDRIYCSETVLPIIKDINMKCSFSDHLAVNSKFQISKKTTYSPPYWRFENALLDDPDFKEHINTYIDFETKTISRAENLLRWWERFKSNLKSVIILYVRQKKRSKMAELRTLQSKIHHIVSKIHPSLKDLDEIASTKKQCQDYYKRVSERVLVRAGYQSLVEVDKPTINRKNFQTSHYIEKLRDHNSDKILTNKEQLCTYIRQHFRRKCSSDEKHKLCLNSDLYNRLPKLTEEDKERLEADLDLSEFSVALYSLNKNKAPGIDGLTSEFYLCFWEKIKTSYHQVFSESLKIGQLPNSTRKAIVSLAPKKGDLLDVENWRAISVLTTDYKILTKALTTRLQNVIGSIVVSDQTCSVPKRSIFDNLHLHRDIIYLANQQNLPLAILNLDQKAAFDNVRHDYLFHVLEIFNFGQYFTNAIKTVYKNALSHIRVGAHLTGEIQFLKGIRQGCPLSGPLYSLTIEPFLSMCRRYLTGFKIPPSIKLTTAAYADDVSIFISQDKDFQLVHEAYSMYQSQSGSQMNETKSVGFWTGSWRNREDTPLDFQWTRDSIKVLGIRFSRNLEEDTEHAFHILSEKIAQSNIRLSQKVPQCSLIGRKILVNQRIAPKLWHSFQVLPFTDQQVDQLQRKLIDFIWLGKHWTTLKDLCVPVKWGGLGLVHLKTRLQLFRLTLVNRLISTTDSQNWRTVLECLLAGSNRFGVTWQWLFITKQDPGDYSRSPFLNTMAKAVLSASVKIHGFPGSVNDIKLIPTTSCKLLNECKPPLFNERWAELGFRTLKDMMEIRDWLPEVSMLQKLRYQTEVVKRDLMNHFRRIKRYFEQRFKEAFEKTTNDSVQWKLMIIKEDNRHLTVNKSMRKPLSEILTAKYFDIHEKMPGAWTDEEVHWEVFFRRPNLGRDADVSWRFAKNRLADPVFLFHSNLRDTTVCPFCPQEVGTAWHILLTCSKVKDLWFFVGQLIRQILGEKLTLSAIYSGYSKRTPQHQLANFLIGIAKSTAYYAALDMIKENRHPLPYKQIFVNRINKRLVLEFSWYSGRQDTDSFEQQWCISEALCKIDSDELILKH